VFSFSSHVQPPPKRLNMKMAIDHLTIVGTPYSGNLTRSL